MARSARPWFCKRTGWWKVYCDGKKVPLAKGKSNHKAAKDALLTMQALARFNPSPNSPDHTVLSVIERYMVVIFPKLSPETRKLRTGYLQSFAELHGWRAVAASRPDHMEEWMNKHPEWVSDWANGNNMERDRNGQLDGEANRGGTQWLRLWGEIQVKPLDPHGNRLLKCPDLRRLAGGPDDFIL